MTFNPLESSLGSGVSRWAREFRDRRILITGATGSFGGALTRKLLDLGAGDLRLFSRDEGKQLDLRETLNTPGVRFFIGDVKDRHSLRPAMDGVSLVFHAAALKQVPVCEQFPLEAIKTNVLGTQNVIDVATECGVDKIVAVSTDKAVLPVNALGLTKALMEKVMAAAAAVRQERTPVLCCARYGNVLASRGSVIPVWIRQIRERDEISVMDPEMTRFLMPMESALDLVLSAAEKGESGDVFVRKMAACRIRDLVEALTETLGVEPRIRVLGARAGDKRHEALLTGEEMSRAEDNGDFYRIPPLFRSATGAGDALPALSSDGVEPLSREAIREMLLGLDCVRQERERLSRERRL